MNLFHRIAPVLIACSAALGIQSQALVPLPEGDFFEPFRPHLSVPNQELILREGDRLAICGDSITEQRMYSRIIETYLTVCVPDLRVSVRQFGWSGERAPGFLSRMTNDVLRFRPTIATTCYGMNDHRYQPFTAEIGDVYSQSSRAIIQAFKSHGVRVVQGSAGTVGKMPSWVKTAEGNVQDLNLGLLELRNIDVQLAREENVTFADVFLPMLIQGHAAQQKYGASYMITGKDGVHPDWAGQLVMAYSFLNAFGLEGNLGQITIDLENKSASTMGGHEVQGYNDGRLTLSSRQYPFCATGALGDDSSMRSGMEWVPFMEELNRLTLKIKNPSAARYRVYWGAFEKVYSSEALSQGVNLAADFLENPFSEAFKKVDQAVAAKQAYETRQIKQIFHGPEGRADKEMAAALTEKTREPLVSAIRDAFQPVVHSIRIVSE
ncbi:MAG: SGNH/GDSL hydrolase family protein [Verrucomicrobia bacterium]|jgi:lysophospholipase L1-like esterase|nr:SGNH/GDSL hydrolase family protein [Verrucomicrobiota bacterium]MBT4275409.1 SGNH/GDSL hydrolase family protein [Verrucomicrobiota bacterium]MBT5062384.1 SGNH/GDSL hydrolase family protein [Verrucomicrobiota bacterium]MBT6805863.1 SGNH/GDSL hydrolase family protein [Verrucomicrobiota bacterium]MBT7536987.1 SGNH/GDSL hydrolase family protein [Verrucomicrobiota bacterium]